MDDIGSAAFTRLMDEVEERIRGLGFRIGEGSASAEELSYFAHTIRQSRAALVAETGFHLGFSSVAFLTADPEVEVVSFDICSHPYVRAAKKLLDEKFPGRHTLITGDSRITVPNYAAERPERKFDAVFIDGGHGYKTARADIENMKALAAPNALVLIDDLTPWLPWGIGPTLAWNNAVRRGLVVQEELYKDGIRVKSIRPFGQRSWAKGRYA